MVNYKALKTLGKRAWDARVLRPGNTRVVYGNIIYRQRNRDSGFTDDDHLIAAAQWLARAQDATEDGGVSGRYRLASGWTSSYPETTGYIIPTFVMLDRELPGMGFLNRASRAARFLRGIQLSGGAFPGGELHENATTPSVFNTAQIMAGLLAWYQASEERWALDAAHKAAGWLIANQDANGAFGRYFYNNVSCTYAAYASCWLAEFGSFAENSAYLNAAARHLEWVLKHVDKETGWFEFCGFSSQDHSERTSLTHTIGYTLWGTLATSEVLNRSDGIEAVQKAAFAIARRLELSGWLSARLDYRWRVQAPYACLTGNSQLALLWMRIYRITGDMRLINAALKSLDLVKQAQCMVNSDAAIRGGIPGSDPVWGDYLYMAFPNWAAKFFIDALITKKKVFSELPLRERSRLHLPINIPTSLPPVAKKLEGGSLNVVMYSSVGSEKVPQMVDGWSTWKFRPSAVVLERRRKVAALTRLKNKIREEGFRWIFARWVDFQKYSTGSDYKQYPDVASYCRQAGIPLLEFDSINSADALAAVRSLRPDLAINAGAGILRMPLLSIPRLGTLNAHMGILPHYRGVNVTEWAWLHGDDIGCSVHLVDAGIDTGDILCIRVVKPTAVLSREKIRAAVDNAQIELLGEVVKFIQQTKELPPRRKQSLEEGKQFFRLHSELATLLGAELRTIKPISTRVTTESVEQSVSIW